MGTAIFVINLCLQVVKCINCLENKKTEVIWYYREYFTVYIAFSLLICYWCRILALTCDFFRITLGIPSWVLHAARGFVWILLRNYCDMDEYYRSASIYFIASDNLDDVGTIDRIVINAFNSSKQWTLLPSSGVMGNPLQNIFHAFIALSYSSEPLA